MGVPTRGGAATALAVRRDGHVTIATWNREHARNALDPPTLLALASVIADATDDVECGACVLTGAGTVAFSAGMDLKALASGQGEVREAVAAWEAAIASPGRKPLVAAVNGMAMGGGFEIALRCDLIVAADHATFGLPEVKRALVPGGGGLRLASRIPLPTALEIALTGEPVSAGRLHDLGLVNRVVPAKEVLTTAVALANQISGHRHDVVSKIRTGMWAAIEGSGR